MPHATEVPRALALGLASQSGCSRLVGRWERAHCQVAPANGYGERDQRSGIVCAVARNDRTAAETFSQALVLATARLHDSVDVDWSSRAGVLDWTCRQTIDHLIDCLFSYALQIAAGSPGPFLPFEELHALPDATNMDLLAGLQGVGELFCRALEAAPSGTCAGDGLVELSAEGWAQRGAYELLVHTHDVLSGLGESFVPPGALCSWVAASEGLWMLDRNRAALARTSWETLLVGSGRPGA